MHERDAFIRTNQETGQLWKWNTHKNKNYNSQIQLNRVQNHKGKFTSNCASWTCRRIKHQHELITLFKFGAILFIVSLSFTTTLNQKISIDAGEIILKDMH